MAQTRVIKEVRMKNTQARLFLQYVLKEHHRLHGADQWAPIPDVADAAGLSPEAAERLLRDMAADQEILMESCLGLGIKDEKYRREGIEKGWWPAVKLLPKEVIEARRKAIEEWKSYRERAAEILDFAISSALPSLSFRVEVQEDGRICLLPRDETVEGKKFVEMVIAADPTAAPGARSAERSRRHPR